MRQIVVTLVLCIPGWAMQAGPEPQAAQEIPEQPAKLEELRAELLSRTKVDQDARNTLVKWMAEYGTNGVVSVTNLTDEQRAAFEKITANLKEVDAANTKWLSAVIEEHGWPTVTLVGKDGASAAWLLVQHADADAKFQRQCLDLMTKLAKEEVSQSNVAYLTDRVLLAEGKNQVYGTQFTVVDGKLVPRPIEDEANVDERRKEVGLPPLAEYAKLIEQHYGGHAHSGGAAGKVSANENGYCIVVSQATWEESEWKSVTETLVAKHAAEVLYFQQSIAETLPALRQRFPRYVCFVCQPDETTREFIAEVSRLTRQLDDDPYTDVLWGILTSYDAAGALRIARQSEPLEIHRVAAGTEVELSLCDEGVWYCELNQGKMVRKLHGQQPAQQTAPADTTKALVDALNDYQAQLFVTSGHATERDWQIGFRYRNGQFRSEKGQLIGVDTEDQRYPIRSENPKVYLPVGNCLMGHIDGPDAMALAFLNSAGVCQMVGYTVPTWYGYAGWGMLDYFLEQPGRFTLAEAFYANQQALVQRLTEYFPDLVAVENGGTAAAPGGPLPPAASAAGLNWNDARGLLFDRDVLAFYGDPAWIARMASAPLAWDQQLDVQDGEYRFEVTPRRNERTFQPINTNGSQRGGRPVFQFLPHRIQANTVQIVEGADLKPLITDNFLLVPVPRQFDPDRPYRVVFRAQPVDKLRAD